MFASAEGFNRGYVNNQCEPGDGKLINTIGAALLRGTRWLQISSSRFIASGKKVLSQSERICVGIITQALYYYVLY